MELIEIFEIWSIQLPMTQNKWNKIRLFRHWKQTELRTFVCSGREREFQLDIFLTFAVHTFEIPHTPMKRKVFLSNCQQRHLFIQIWGNSYHQHNSYYQAPYLRRIELIDEHCSLSNKSTFLFFSRYCNINFVTGQCPVDIECIF